MADSFGLTTDLKWSKTEPMWYTHSNVLLKTYKVWLQGAAPDPIEKGGWYDETNMYYTTF